MKSYCNSIFLRPTSSDFVSDLLPFCHKKFIADCSESACTGLAMWIIIQQNLLGFWCQSIDLLIDSTGKNT